MEEKFRKYVRALYVLTKESAEITVLIAGIVRDEWGKAERELGSLPDFEKLAEEARQARAS